MASSMSMKQIAGLINERSVDRPFGKLQRIRKNRNGGKRLANRYPFRDVHSDWACHHGGRPELQFNFGDEPGDRLRHGVAFSFKQSQTLPDYKVLLPKVERFNEFLRVNPDYYSDLLMWHWDDNNHDRSPSEQRPAPIPNELVQEGFFVFMGKMQPRVGFDVEEILADYDRLLTLYNFVEGTSHFPEVSDVSTGLKFRSGHHVLPPSTEASQKGGTLDVNLRHGQIQTRLHSHLCTKYGEDNVGTEIPAVGGKIDVVVRQKTNYTYYEIKTGLSARACIREGLSQILEYSYWPGATQATELVIVGEPELDAKSTKYLHQLRKQFVLPVSYAQFDFDSGRIR
jgi:hypothetical protein